MTTKTGAKVDGAQIDAALAAHAAWKNRLSQAATDKNRDLPVGTICRDDRCAFGEWFYARPKVDQLQPCPHKVRRLHAAFHMMAGNIALDIAVGDFQVALDKIHSASFRRMSDELATALSAWKSMSDTPQAKRPSKLR